MTAGKMLSLFAGEEGMAMLWRLPSLGKGGRSFHISRRLETSLKKGAFPAVKKPLPKKGLLDHREENKSAAVSLADREAISQSLREAADFFQAGQLLEKETAFMEAAFPKQQLHLARDLGSGMIQKSFAYQALELVRQKEKGPVNEEIGGFGRRLSESLTFSKASGFNGLSGGTLTSPKAAGGNRAAGQRLRQAASGRDMLLARSIGFLREQESENGNFDRLLDQLERQLAIELGAG